MLGILTGMRVPSGGPQGSISFDFAIFAATFPPPSAEWFYYLLKSNKCAPLATLHTYGETDSIIVPEKSKSLAVTFEDQAAAIPNEHSSELHEKDARIYKTTVMRLEHPGGHYVPTNSASKKNYKEFFEAFQKDFKSA